MVKPKVKKATHELASYIAHRINLNDLESSRPLLQYIVEKKQVSLSDVSKALSLSAGTCNLHLQRLEHERLIRRFETISRGRGRPVVIWGVNDAANLTACLVFDVPFVHASLADFAMTPVLREAYDLSSVSTADELLGIVRGFLTRASRQAEVRNGQIRQVLVLLPGLLDAGTGMVRNAVNFPLLNGVDFNRQTAQSVKLPCTTAALGLAFYFGESEQLPPDSNNMVIYWDLGVGVVFGRGDHFSALGGEERNRGGTLAEIGHVRIRKAGRRCHCGNVGCLEAYTGGWALIEELNRKSVRGLNDFIQLALHGDEQALRIARTAAETLGRHLLWAIQVMQVDRIRVSGPMAPVFALVADDFRRGLSELLSEKEIARLDVKASPVLEERFLRGAHRLAQRLFSHPEDYQLLPRSPHALARPD